MLAPPYCQRRLPLRKPTTASARPRSAEGSPTLVRALRGSLTGRLKADPCDASLDDAPGGETALVDGEGVLVVGGC